MMLLKHVSSIRYIFNSLSVIPVEIDSSRFSRSSSGELDRSCYQDREEY